MAFAAMKSCLRPDWNRVHWTRSLFDLSEMARLKATGKMLIRLNWNGQSGDFTR